MQRRRRSKRSGLLAATAMIAALATLGLGYATWTRQLTINGTVDTAHMGMRWTDPDGNPDVCNETGDPFNAASAQIVRDTLDEQLLHFSLTNGFPGYAAECSSVNWKMDSNSVPVSLTHLSVTTFFPPTETLVAEGQPPTAFDLDGDGLDDVEITISGPIFATYVPSLPGNTGGALDFKVEVLPTAPEGATLDFMAQLHFEIDTTP